MPVMDPPRWRRHAALPPTATLVCIAAASIAALALAAPTTAPLAPVEAAPPAVAALPFADDPLAELRTEAREAIVTRSDGRRVEGTLLREDADVVELDTGSTTLIIPTTQVASIDILPPMLERYEAMKSRLSPGDAAGAVVLVKWLRDRRAYRIALAEVRAVLAFDPSHREAADLAWWLENQLRFNLAGPGRTPATPGPSRTTGPGLADFPLLNADEINLIRVFEINLQAPPPMIISGEAVDRFITSYADHELMPKSEVQRDALRRAPAGSVLDLMFRVRARDFYGEVKVQRDPESLRVFRERVHQRWLMNACATNDCHGGQEAGRLYLLNRGANRPAVVYTNFLILERFRLANGDPLINYETPELSPLLQMGLNRAKAQTPHPNVNNPRGQNAWTPIFRDADEFRFREAVDWIKSMYQPRPDYPIEYTPPVARGAVPPAQGPVER